MDDVTETKTSKPPLTATAATAMAARLAIALTEAADSAVESIPAEIMAMGATPEQGRAIADAVRLFLLKPFEYRELARSILMEGGFVNGNVDMMLNKIE